MSQANAKKLAKRSAAVRLRKEHPAHFTEYYLEQLMRGKLPRTSDFLFNARFQFSATPAAQRLQKGTSSSLQVGLRQNAIATHIEYGPGLTGTEASMLVQSLVSVTALTYAALGFRVSLPAMQSNDAGTLEAKQAMHKKGKGN